MAAEWRRALRQLQEEHRLSTAQLRHQLTSVNVVREDQTIEGWLDLTRASPIAPRALRRELSAIWTIVAAQARHQLSDVQSACTRLRSLRVAASNALLRVWKGEIAKLDVDREWLAQLVGELRQSVRVYEIVSVSLGVAPRVMLGWSIHPALAAQFERADLPASPDADNGDEDSV
jgi:hypothetical protein